MMYIISNIKDFLRPSLKKVKKKNVLKKSSRSREKTLIFKNECKMKNSKKFFQKKVKKNTYFQMLVLNCYN